MVDLHKCVIFSIDLDKVHNQTATLVSRLWGNVLRNSYFAVELCETIVQTVQAFNCFICMNKLNQTMFGWDTQLFISILQEGKQPHL